MPGELTIRLARADERPMLIGLQRQASLMWEEDRAALLAEPDAIDVPVDQIAEGHVHVCERGGVVVGFSVVAPRQDGSVELDGLFVDPAVWRQGIGRRLVRHCEAVAHEAGARSLNVVANKRAAGFYLACDFQVLGEVPTQFSPGWSMVKAV